MQPPGQRLDVTAPRDRGPSPATASVNCPERAQRFDEQRQPFSSTSRPAKPTTKLSSRRTAAPAARCAAAARARPRRASRREPTRAYPAARMPSTEGRRDRDQPVEARPERAPRKSARHGSRRREDVLADRDDDARPAARSGRARGSRAGTGRSAPPAPRRRPGRAAGAGARARRAGRVVSRAAWRAPRSPACGRIGGAVRLVDARKLGRGRREHDGTDVVARDDLLERLPVDGVERELAVEDERLRLPSAGSRHAAARPRARRRSPPTTRSTACPSTSPTTSRATRRRSSASSPGSRAPARSRRRGPRSRRRGRGRRRSISSR